MQPADVRTFREVAKILRPLKTPRDGYEEFCQTLSDAMTRGLRKETHSKSSVKMFPSYVFAVPDGTEQGHFLALDLGGTNYRVLLVKLGGKGVHPVIEERTYAIPNSKKSGAGKDLFDYIATTLAEFRVSHHVEDLECNLGFTFSFPCIQHGLTDAKLARWTKGYSASDVEGRNVAELLQNAIDRAGIKVKCVAVVNDTVGTLASCALEDQKCAIGLIVGTGTNAAYIERTDCVETLDNPKSSYVVINTEWGAFGENGEIDALRTQFDKTVDSESLHPGKQIFEKMVSGMYLGEIVRQIMLHLIEKKLLFGGEVPAKLTQKDSVLTKYLTETERDPPRLFHSAHQVLTEDLEVPIVEPIDARIMRYACKLVCKRAAYLAGAGVAAILRRMNRQHVTIGIDGSLYKFHPKFRERMTDIIDRLKPANMKFRLRLSEDGSGKGAAAIAAASTRLNHTAQLSPA